MKVIESEELKNMQLDILKKVDAYCKEHGIQYFLAYGTLLGAVRHKGFIPWDDDIDIAMKREDYEQFVTGFADEYLKVYALGTSERCRFPFAKVYDSRTSIFEGSYKKTSEFGVNIDIFPLDAVPDDKKMRQALIRKARFWQMLSKIKLSRVSKIMTLKQNLIILPGRIILAPIPLPSMARRIEAISSSWKDKQTDSVGFMVWGYGEKEMFSKELFAEVVDMRFEDIFVPVPKEYDKILTSLYGSYMEYPPLDKQVSQHDFVACWME
ncbi:MAG: LicD family protein [Sphaerochaeta sp.]|nr:LicD family protein [Sphaerochaeta sp.]